MCARSAFSALEEKGFDLRLSSLLDEVYASSGATFVGVAELMAPNGILLPHWRATAPRATTPTLPPLQRFTSLVQRGAPHTWLADAVELFPDFAGLQALLIDVSAEPQLHEGCDALLLLTFTEPPSMGGIAELRAALREALLKDRQRRLAQIVYKAVRDAGDPFEVTDRHARLLYANRAWEQTFGYEHEQVTGQTVGRLFRDPVQPIHDRAFYQFTLDGLAQGEPWLGVLASRSNSGIPVLCEVHVSPFTAKEEAFQGNVAVRRRLDHRAERDKALAIAHHEFRAVLSAMPDGVVVLRDTRIYFANAAFLEMVGKQEDEVIGRDYASFVHPDDREQFRREHVDKVTRVRVMREGRPRVAEISTAGAVSFEAKPAMILLSRDATDYYLAQEELVRAEKLSALGALAAGVAHEINNPLAYVTLNLQQVIDSAKERLAPGELEALEEALEGAARMRSIVSELKGYSGSDRPGPTEPVAVLQAVSSALNIAQNEIRHRARLKREHEPGLFVLGREGQLVQVLVNVLVNAAQAIPTADARDHLICVTSRRASEDRVRITVSDTGAGIPDAVLAHVFDPFATGKRRGEGAGLGLTISKRIVEDFGGSIHIESKPGSGTRVILDLPSAEAPPMSAPVKSVRCQAVLPKAKVLIVDDELPVAKGLKRMLAGHDVVILRDGREALELLRREPSFDVVLCDLMMPSLPGSELFQQVTRDHPELGSRFVFMTGGAFTDYGRSFLEQVKCPILKKPFDPEVVLESVRNAMLTRR